MEEDCGCPAKKPRSHEDVYQMDNHRCISIPTTDSYYVGD